MSLPIDVIPGTDPPKFRWRQIVGTVMGDRVMDYESGVPPTLEPALVELIALVKRQAAEIEELRRGNREVATQSKSPLRQESPVKHTKGRG